MINPKYVVKTFEDLGELYGSPAPMAIKKETPIINDEYSKLIENSPFCALATIGSEGMDCSPRGDDGHIAYILDERHIMIADRRGNNRLDSLKNIVEDGRVALLFLIPGWNECLRINGNAVISTDPNLCKKAEMQGKLPASVIIVKIETMYFQCARAIKRSGLWLTDKHINPKSLPSAGQLTKSVETEFDADAYDAELQDRQAKTLY